MQTVSPERGVAERPAVLAGPTLVFTAALSIAAMALHPTTGAHGVFEALAEMAEESRGSGWVHGVLVVLLLLQLVGFTELVRWLAQGGARARLRELLAVVAFAAGALAYSGAALVNGFVVPRFAAGLVDAPADTFDLVPPLLQLAFEANQVLAQAGVLAVSVAIAAASSALPRVGGPTRALAACGYLVAGAASLGILSRHLRLDVHGMGAVVLAHGLWLAAAGVWLQRRRSAAQSSRTQTLR